MFFSVEILWNRIRRQHLQKNAADWTSETRTNGLKLCNEKMRIKLLPRLFTENHFTERHLAAIQRFFTIKSFQVRTFEKV